MSGLTLQEMEREAYQRGETEKAELLRLALDGESTAVEELEYEAENQRERADEAESAFTDLQETIFKHLVKIEDAVKEGDAEAIAAAFLKAREDI